MGRIETGAGRARGFARSILTLAICAATFVATDGMSGQARSENRTLSFKQLHTGETLEITYKRNGRYDSAALKKINYILRDWRRNEATTMDPKLLDLIWEVRKRVGTNAPIHVLSGYRSPVTNAMLRSRSRGVAKYSQHMAGKALDFYIPGVKLSTLRQTGLKFQVGGVGYYPTSGSPFVHLDTGNVRHWPRMTRTQLAKLFPNGRTLHIPSDGKPMPGRNQAVTGLKSTGGTKVASLSSGRKQVVLTNSRLDPSAPVITASTGRGGGGSLISSLFTSSSKNAPAKDTPEAKPVKPGKPTLVASLGNAASTTPAPIPRLKPADAIAAVATAEAAAEAAPETTATVVAVADTPLPAPRPILVAALEPAAEADDQPLLTASLPQPEEKPLITASLPRLPAETVLPRDRPLVAALDTIAALIAGNKQVASARSMPALSATRESGTTNTPGITPVSLTPVSLTPASLTSATALASTATLPNMPPFATTFTGQRIPLRDGPTLVAIDYRQDALKAYLDPGTCLRAPTFVALRHPDQTDLGALTVISGPVVVNEFRDGPQLIYPMRRFTGPAVAPVATRTYRVASAQNARENTRAGNTRTVQSILRATSLR